MEIAPIVTQLETHVWCVNIGKRFALDGALLIIITGRWSGARLKARKQEFFMYRAKLQVTKAT
ncbi:hypothetical protein T07_15187, partial [Trichinella nelsoni]